MSIQDIVLKIKGLTGTKRLDQAFSALKLALLVVIGILIGITGFFCGKIEHAKTVPSEPISVISPPQPVVSQPLFQAKMATNHPSASQGLGTSPYKGEAMLNHFQRPALPQ